MSTTSTQRSNGNRHETQVIAEPDLPTVRIVREFDAPVHQLFRAHTDPELFAKWNGPNSVDSRIDSWSCETGGAYRYACVRGDEEYGFYGSFHEVRENERIVQTFCFDGMPDGVALETGTFEDLGDGRSRLTWLSVVDSVEARDAFVASGMETGVVEGYEKLDELLAGLS